MLTDKTIWKKAIFPNKYDKEFSSTFLGGYLIWISVEVWGAYRSKRYDNNIDEEIEPTEAGYLCRTFAV